MPIRMLFERLQQHRAETNAIHNNDARDFNLGGSESHAHSNALTNAINVAGIPIKNTVSGTHIASTDGGHTGSFKEQFSIGNLGITAGLNGEELGTGFGVTRKPGEFGVHLGALNLGVTNHANDMKNTQTETVAASSATGAGSTSISESNTHSNGLAIGNAFNIQNTVSSSHAHSASLTGTTSAGVGAAGSQNAQIPNIGSPNPSYPEPNPEQPNVQQPHVEMTVVDVGQQQEFEQYRRPAPQPTGIK